MAAPSTPPQSSDPADRPGSASHSPALSDDSAFELPDFPYFTNSQGEFVRMKTPSPEHSPSPSAISRRASLSRSESAPTVMDPAPPPPPSNTTTRQFTRVASVPVSSMSTPATTSTYFPRSSGLSSTSRKFGSGAPRRVVRLEDRENAEREQTKENGDAVPFVSTSTNARPLSEVIPVPQRTIAANGRQVLPVPSRYTSRMKKVETIAEVSDEREQYSPRASLLASTGIRPRRSASLSDTAPEDLPWNMRSAANLGARRVTLEEKLKREREIALEEGYARALAEREQEQLRRAAMEGHLSDSRQTPSPTRVNAQPAPSNSRPVHGHHHRTESDTVQSSVTAGSPTVIERRRSPSNPTTDTSNSSGEHNRPNGVQYQNGDRLAANPAQGRRRSPTNPEPPISHDYAAQSENVWASENGNGYGQEAEDQRQDIMYQKQLAKAAMRQQQQQQQQQMMQQAPPPRKAPSMPPQQSAFGQGKQMMIGNKPYTRLDMIGRGGTSRVYKVVSPTNEILALKRVQLDPTDHETMKGYMNEISLLKRLDGNDRIIRLVDSDTKTSGSNKGLLFLLMELGEIDMAKLLQEQQKRPMDFVWVAYYFKQMLEAVHVIHEEKIIHSDLKPANFVLVKGQLKLIDFGIANAIANDTTNIHRDHQVGTVNYMSPESIENPDGRGPERHYKVGRASDVWSLGCILYQMVYGHPPFHYYSGIVQKMKAIPDPSVPIQFPETVDSVLPSHSSVGGAGDGDGKVKVPVPIIETMKRCLARNAKERATIPELLTENWLTMRELQSPADSSEGGVPFPHKLGPGDAIVNENLMLQVMQYVMSLPDMERSEASMRAISGNIITQLQSLR